MNTVEIKGEGIRNICESLSVTLATNFTEELTEYEIGIPEKFGKGKIQGVNFPNGVGLILLNLNFNEEFQFNFYNPNSKILKFIYCTRGKFKFKFQGDQLVCLESFQSLIAANSSDQGHSFNFLENKEIQVCLVEIHCDKFKEHINYNLEDIPQYFYELFEDKARFESIYHKSNYSLLLSKVIEEVFKLNARNLVRINFLGAKALEIVSLMLSQYEDDIKNGGMTHILRRKELQKVKKVADFIKTNNANVGTIDELSYQFNLSSAKLQLGFQSLYHLSINEFMQQIRLDKAVFYLEEGEKNISEIVYALGLSSRSYFSKIFKKRYGISPRDYAQSKKKPQ